jgi:hypothetical protein
MTSATHDRQPQVSTVAHMEAPLVRSRCDRPGCHRTHILKLMHQERAQTMSVTLINIFEVPAGGEDAFIAAWERPGTTS